MKAFLLTLKAILLLLTLTCNSVLSADIFKADGYFAHQQYTLARSAYLEAAQIGSPHAYYQLGTIYLRGLNVQQDPIQALIWFSLAAEYEFGDSERIAQQIFSLLSEKEQSHYAEIVASFKHQFGKQKILSQYFPVLDQANLQEKVTFSGAGKLENIYQDPDLLLGSFDDNSVFEDDFSSFDLYDDFDQQESVSTAETAVSALPRPSAIDLTRRKPFLIVDYDVGSDGSIRNLSKVQTIGYSNLTIEQFERSSLPQPTFKGKRIDFVNRTYLGTAIYSHFQMREEQETLFLRIRRLAKTLKSSPEREEQYQYAMALMHFTWLDQREGEADAILKQLAEAGHPNAQYEYGLKLYREQQDIPTAIHWISEASKYGLVKAQYRLARILQTSPWVTFDEKKALFWFESAMSKGHEAATLKAAELKLLASDTSLVDLQGAIEYLQVLDGKQNGNPEYNFLLAISHKNRQNRNFKNVVKYMQRAISLGEGLNWDVSYWESLLAAWTTGSVYIVD